MPFPTNGNAGITVREALTKHIDLQGAIPKKTLQKMIPFCEKKEDRKL